MGEEILQILLHIGIGIFLDQERGAGVADETGQQAIFDVRAAQEGRHVMGEFHQARAMGPDRDGVKGLPHLFFLK
jgi:hypothetical protein